MGNNKIQEIYTRLAEDKAFAEELKNFVKGKKFTSLEDEAMTFVEFAQSKNYDISLEAFKAFIENQCKALNEEELDSVNAAGLASIFANAIINKKSGGLCLGAGIGWGEASGYGDTKCYIIGEGLGVSWEKSNWYEETMSGSKK
jgi:hypothetical protein